MTNTTTLLPTHRHCSISNDDDPMLRKQRQRQPGMASHNVPIFDYFVFPALLFFQFDTVMYYQQFEGTLTANWTGVNYSIVLFTLVAAAYRRSVIKMPLFMLPEFFLILIGLVACFKTIQDAHDFLLFSVVILSCLGCIATWLQSRDP